MEQSRTPTSHALPARPTRGRPPSWARLSPGMCRRPRRRWDPRSLARFTRRLPMTRWAAKGRGLGPFTWLPWLRLPLRAGRTRWPRPKSALARRAAGPSGSCSPARCADAFHRGPTGAIVCRARVSAARNVRPSGVVRVRPCLPASSRGVGRDIVGNWGPRGKTTLSGPGPPLSSVCGLRAGVDPPG